MPLNPRIAETNGGSLTHYAEGKWKNYNTVLESAVYDVALHRNGHVVHVWLKNVAKKEKKDWGKELNELLKYQLSTNLLFKPRGKKPTMEA